jgi:gluconolactonase
MAISDYDIIEPEFRELIRISANVERLYTGCRWAEGPAYLPAHRYLVWSDIPNDRILRWDEMSGAVGVFRAPASYANGATVDRQGRLLHCEHGGRRVIRTEHDGSVTVLADRYEGGRLNSPNDLVVRSDGSIWFTDPTYGIDSDYEGHKSSSEQSGSHVYRLGVDDALARVIDDMGQPNGIAFSPDERRLYVADTGATHRQNHPREIRAFDVGADGQVSGGSTFAELKDGLFDGFRVDEDGRVWTSAGSAVHCYAPDGRLLGRILLPETVANVAFGGLKRNRLFICATTSLYSVMMAVNGAKTF